MKEISDQHRAMISKGLKQLWQDPAYRERRAKDSPEWPPERVALLLKLTRDGNSASEVAAIMRGGLTRSAVVGKWHRLRNEGCDIITPPKRQPVPKPPKMQQPYLSDGPKLLDVSLANIHFTDRGRTYNKCAPSNFAPTSAKASPVALRAMGDKSAARAPGRSVKEPKPLRLEGNRRVTVLDLSSQTCRWPIGDPGTADFCFCGHEPAQPSPYCEFHRRAALPQTAQAPQRKFG